MTTTTNELPIRVQSEDYCSITEACQAAIAAAVKLYPEELFFYGMKQKQVDALFDELTSNCDRYKYETVYGTDANGNKWRIMLWRGGRYIPKEVAQ